jgi:hypothetical protein
VRRVARDMGRLNAWVRNSEAFAAMWQDAFARIGITDMLGFFE